MENALLWLLEEAQKNAISMETLLSNSNANSVAASLNGSVGARRISVTHATKDKTMETMCLGMKGANSPSAQAYGLAL